MPRTKHSKNVWGPALLLCGVGLQLIGAVIPRMFRSGYDVDEDMIWFVGFIATMGFIVTCVGLFGGILAKRYSGGIATMSVFALCAGVIALVLALDYPFRLVSLIGGLLALAAFWLLPVPGANEGR